jgi:peptide chain release factor subunit 1
VITRTAADKLRAIRAEEPAVISVYLSIPLDLAEHRALPTRARELVKAALAEQPEHGRAQVREADLESIAQAVSMHSRDWLAHTAAIFACADVDLFEVVPLPGALTELAVVADRPYVRPLRAAIQRNPSYRAALVDTRYAWVLNISDDQIETVAERTDPGVPSSGFSGWWGLEAHRVQQRIMTLSKQHFKDTVAILERTGNGERRPLVLGGHEPEISQFLGALPRAVRHDVVGSVSVDLHTVTPGRIRELASPVLARWAEQSEAQLVEDVLGEPPNTSVTTDLDGCLAAARSHAVAQLVLTDDQMVPGFACDDCGALSVKEAGCDCPEPAQAYRAVPDVLDELANRTLDGGGEVTSVRKAPFTAAARLRFPVPASAPVRRGPGSGAASGPARPRRQRAPGAA